MVVPRRFDVFLVALDPTVGSEIQKTRPCLVISPDDLNLHLATTIVAPMTTGGRQYPTRIPCEFQGKAGWVALDQIRTTDRARLIRRLGRINPETGDAVLDALAELFAP